MRLTSSPPTEAAALASALARVQAEADRPITKPKRNALRNAPSTTTAPKLSENKTLNGLELRFPGPIPRALSRELQGAGWRFHRGGGVDPRWWRKRSDEALAFANGLVKRLAGSTGGQVVSAVPAGQEIEPLIWTPDAPVFKRLVQLVAP